MNKQIAFKRIRELEKELSELRKFVERRTFSTLEEAITTLKAELVDFDRRTSRSFWVDGVNYLARKTNVSTGHVNLTIKECNHV